MIILSIVYYAVAASFTFGMNLDKECLKDIV